MCGTGKRGIKKSRMSVVGQVDIACVSLYDLYDGTYQKLSDILGFALLYVYIRSVHCWLRRDLVFAILQ